MSDTHDGIGWAVKQMWNGDRVRRRGWNGKGMYIAIMSPGVEKMTEPYVYMFTAQGYFIPWLCSQADLLATDWELAEASHPMEMSLSKTGWSIDPSLLTDLEIELIHSSVTGDAYRIKLAFVNRTQTILEIEIKDGEGMKAYEALTRAMKP